MKRGFGIAETLIASTIIASLILAFMGIAGVMSRSAQLSYQQTVAANLAQRRIEELRFSVESAWHNSRQTTDTISDTEWAQLVVSDLTPQQFTVGGFTYTTRVTVDRAVTDLPPLYAKNASGASIAATASDTATLLRRVHVDVTWTDGSPRSYALETVLTNWREGLL